MAFLRPEATALILRWREVLTGLAFAALGAWISLWGGPFFAVIGGGLALTGAALALIGWRRMRFARGAGAPGVVEVVEGQVSYFGPHHGGFAALADLTELALVPGPDGRVWRLSQPDGTVLAIPTTAAGAEALFDAFSGLPGLDSATLIAALDGRGDVARIVWRRRRPARLLH